MQAPGGVCQKLLDGAITKGFLHLQFVGVAVAEQAEIFGQHRQFRTVCSGSLQQTPGAAQVGLDLRAGDHLYCGYFHGVDGWFPLVAFEGGLLWEAVLRSTLVTWGFAQEPST